MWSLKNAAGFEMSGSSCSRGNRRQGAESKVLGMIRVGAPDAHLDVGKLKSVGEKLWYKILQREKTGTICKKAGV